MKGVYCLLIDVSKNTKIKIGALGEIFFKKGKYVYVGSAQNNILKRVERHIKKEKKIRWHIDYLLSSRNSEIKDVYYKKSGKEEECRIADRIAEDAVQVKGFGCSDCKCKSHLLFTKGNIIKIFKVLGMKKLELA